MVLTQPIEYKEETYMYPVSIPLWFLRNTSQQSLRVRTSSSFHTTMVLTQPERRQYFAEFLVEVSIPLWFLRNQYRPGAWKKMSIKFPYHYGSYATKCNTGHFVAQFNVSIPLWFLRNLCLA